MLEIAGILSGLFSGAANDILKVVGGAILDALKGIISYVCTFWVHIPTPELAGSTGDPSQPVSFLRTHLQWYVGAAAVFSILIGCGRMGWEQKGEHGRELVKGMLLLIIVSGCALTVIQLLVTVSDDFSTWILSESLGGASGSRLGTAFAAQLTAMLGATALGGAVPIFLAIVLGGFALLMSIIQAFLMVVRGGMLVVLAGVLPLTFSFWSTEAGRNWSRRSISWLIAFILYKPAAAIVYATAFQLVGDGGGLIDVFTGITLMGLALLALPALMRFVTPMVGSIAAGGSGMALGMISGIAAAGMMPTGAIAAVPAAAQATGAVPAATTGQASSARAGAPPPTSAPPRVPAAAVGSQIGSGIESGIDHQAGGGER